VSAVSQHPQTRSAWRLTRVRTRHVTHSRMKATCSKEYGNGDKPAIFQRKRVLRDVYTETLASERTVGNP